MESLREQLLEPSTKLEALQIGADQFEQAMTDEELGPLIAAMAVDQGAVVASSPDPLDAAANTDDPKMAARLVAMAAALEDPELDERIDTLLADAGGAKSTVQGLVRAGVDWFHPALLEQLGDEDVRFGAAWLLARSGADELTEYLADVEDSSAVVDILRAVSVSDGTEWFDEIADWRRHLVEDLSDEDARRIDAALACADPARYARLLLAGDVSDDWLVDDRAVADFLMVHGPTRWAAPLAVFRHVYDSDAFALGASWAVSTSFIEPLQDLDDEQLDPGGAADWIERQPGRVSFQLAQTDDDQFGELLVEAALHETLVRRGVQPPALTGLALSGHPPDAGELDERLKPLEELSMDEPHQRLQLIRTLTDLVRLTRQGAVERADAAPIFERFAGRGDAAKLVARRFDEDRPVGYHGDWGCRGIDALNWQLEAPGPESLLKMAMGGFDGPLDRAGVWREGFEQVRHG